jgi:hypothetical protein
MEFHEYVNLFSGKSGSGKSTVMDAIQVILYGSVSAAFLNKAADDAKNKRSVLSYLRGAQKDGTSNRENVDFCSQIVLELEDTGGRLMTCIGAVFEVGSQDTELRKYHFFSHSGRLPEDGYLTDQGIPYTSAQLTQQLQKNGLGVGTSVKSLELTYSDLGNVIRATVHWANGQSSTISASNIRSRFDVRSIRFTVNGAGTGETSTPDLPGNSEEIYINGSPVSGGLEGKYVISSGGTVSQAGDKPYAINGTGSISAIGSGGEPDSSTAPQPGSGTVTISGSTYTFNGGGWGHQVGMSQYGANAMARRGFTGSEIVAFYFPGVQVAHF